MSNYERSYWELVADEQLSKKQIPMLSGRGFGRINNNRKATRGRKIQVIQMKNGSSRQIRKPSLG